MPKHEDEDDDADADADAASSPSPSPSPPVGGFVMVIEISTALFTGEVFRPAVAVVCDHAPLLPPPSTTT